MSPDRVASRVTAARARQGADVTGSNFPNGMGRIVQADGEKRAPIPRCRMTNSTLEGK